MHVNWQVKKHAERADMVELNNLEDQQQEAADSNSRNLGASKPANISFRIDPKLKQQFDIGLASTGDNATRVLVSKVVEYINQTRLATQRQKALDELTIDDLDSDQLKLLGMALVAIRARGHNLTTTAIYNLLKLAAERYASVLLPSKR